MNVSGHPIIVKIQTSGYQIQYGKRGLKFSVLTDSKENIPTTKSHTGNILGIDTD